MTQQRSSTRDKLVAAAVASGLFVCLFWQVLFQPRFFSFRDTGSFFHPLLKFVHREWSAGRIPLWNPYSCGGAPLFAQGTPAVLYPLQVIFRLPLPFEVNLNLYILVHFALAVGFTYALARRFRAGPAAAALAAIAYTFGGIVLIQYGNLPFLCSGAWMPAAWYAGWEMLHRRSFGWALVLAAISALMVLAGDPQSAYHALGLPALAAVIRWSIGRRRAAANPQASSTAAQWAAGAWRRRTLPLLFASGAAALLLSAVQVLPTLELSRLSTRAVRQVPDSLYQIPGFLLRKVPPTARADTGAPPHWYDSLAGNPPPPVTNHLIRYDFSFIPWRLVEFVWPNFSGKLSGGLRWMIEAGGESPRCWIASCYLGLAPLVLALVVFDPRRRRPVVAWLSWIALLGTLASFGGYGPVWLFRVVAQGKIDAFGEVPGGEVGGLYWLASMLLPAYDTFRYPAKLLSLTALALSLLAALGLQRLLKKRAAAERAWRVLMVILGLSWVGLLATLLISDPLEGPAPAGFNWATMAADVRWSLGQTAVVAMGCAAWLGWGLREGNWRRLTLWTPPGVLVLTAIDLALANGWCIETVPISARAVAPAVVRAIEAEESGQPRDPGSRPFPRVYALANLPGDVFQNGGVQFPLAYGQGRFSPLADTFQLQSLETTLNCLPAPNVGFVHPRRLIDAWGADYLIWPKDGRPDESAASPLGLSTAWREPRSSPADRQLVPAGPLLPAMAANDPNLAEILLVRNPSAARRTWIVRQFQTVSPIAPDDRAGWLNATLLLGFSPDTDFDLRRVALVEDEALLAKHGPGLVQIAEPMKPAEDFSNVTSYRSDQVEVAADLAAAGLVVLADTDYPGWRLVVQSGDQPPAERPILRVNHAMRGVLLPAGKHQLTFRYQPASFWRGAAISGVSWLALMAFGAVRLITARRRLPRAQG